MAYNSRKICAQQIMTLWEWKALSLWPVQFSHWPWMQTPWDVGVFEQPHGRTEMWKLGKWRRKQHEPAYSSCSPFFSAQHTLVKLRFHLSRHVKLSEESNVVSILYFRHIMLLIFPEHLDLFPSSVFCDPIVPFQYLPSAFLSGKCLFMQNPPADPPGKITQSHKSVVM